MLAEVVRARLVAYARDAALDARRRNAQAREQLRRAVRHYGHHAPLPLRRGDARVGNVLYLYAVVTPENAPSANSLTWASSNEGVASVDQSGRVEALSEGTAEITASADGVSARCTVTVETIAGGNEGTGEENWK